MDETTTKNMVKTGIKRRYILWYFILSSTLLCIFSEHLKISDSKFDTYIFFALSISLSIIGSKGFDNFNKFKIKNMEINKNE